LTEENVLFVTIDSCRLDTARAVATPNFDRIGPMIACHTTATFTLPAHLSFFAGFLPVPIQPQPVFRNYDRLWRSRAARYTSKRVYQWVESSTIIEHYRAQGYSTIGLGGVQFFDTANPANILPALFDRFDYCGLRAGQALDGGEHTFTAHALESVVAGLGARTPSFVFANLSETHFPYLSPGCADDARTAIALDIMRRGAADKRVVGISEHELIDRLRPARMRQCQALQWVDSVFGRIAGALLQLSLPTLVVVCADHGDSFGERGMIGHGHPAPEVMEVPMWVGRIPAGG